MDREGVTKTRDSCYGGASLAGAVIGTFLTTILLLVVAALVYRQWRRHKGKHLVLVTNPEIVEDAYAFDNPCFKDATPAVNRNHDGSGPLSTPSLVVESTPTTGKDSARWSSPWSSLVFTGTSVNKNDRRRTLDDSCLGTKATRISVVSLRSHDFTGLGFNVCGNMREGIFVKDLLHRGPASESGRINPGDRIASVKISFRSMVYEDALTILSYASPYDVELEVESGGGSGSSRPTTLLKKSVGPSTSRICHPLYRSQSIPELSQAHKASSSKRLFIADPGSNESIIGSNYSTMNSTMKSSKSTTGNNQSLERRHEEAKAQNNHHHHHHHHHHKFGIKVLPALDGTVHRIENQNEHNTNLERRNSRRLDIETGEEIEPEKSNAARKFLADDEDETRHAETERCQKRDTLMDDSIRHDRNSFGGPLRSSPKSLVNGHDATDPSSGPDSSVAVSTGSIVVPSDVPAEVHNAAMAARRNRKNSTELLLNAARSTISESPEASSDLKSPQKNKRKAPPPPVNPSNDRSEIGKIDPANERQTPSPGRNNNNDREISHDGIESITDYVESLNDYVVKIRDEASHDRQDETTTIVGRSTPDVKSSSNRRVNDKSDDDSDNDSEIHDSFTTIELKPADITIHHTPTSQTKHRGRSNGRRDLNDGKADDNVDEDDDEDDDVYRKAASLGDLSKYENKSLATLERAQSLDMADAGCSKKRNKHAVIIATHEDANESSENLTRIEDADTFDQRKLKKSNEWGTLEDAIWKKSDVPVTSDESSSAAPTRTRLNGSLERSRSSIETRNDEKREKPIDNADDDETSLELYNLPLSIGLTRDFVRNERMFDPDGDNSLARIVNNGRIVKSPTPSYIESDFRRATPDVPDFEDFETPKNEQSGGVAASPNDEEFGMAIRYFDRETCRLSINDENSGNPFDIGLTSRRIEDRRIGKERTEDEDLGDSLYAGKREVREEPIRRVIVSKGCPGCERKHARHDHDCRNEPRARTKRESVDDRREPVDWKPQEIGETITESVNDRRDNGRPSAFEIGLGIFERSPTDSRHDRKFSTERDVASSDLLDKNDESVEADDPEDDDEEVYEFGSAVTVNSKTVTTSPVADRRNVSNVSVSSGENSEDSGLVRESGDYSRQDSSEGRPPLPDTPAPISVKDSSIQKLTYITEINLSTSADSQSMRDVDLVDNATKAARNEIALTSNGKTIGSKKPPVPPRRNDASRMMQSRDTEAGNDKRVVYVSEYRSSGSNNDVIESSGRTMRPAESGNGPDGSHRDKNKFENWIYLGDSNGERNPWGNGGGSDGQQRPVTNIVVSGDEKNKNPRQ